MQSRQAKIDHGNAFDWGKTSAQYAQFRDIYPPVFYEQLLARFPEQQGKQILDIGTGTGVLPRHLYSYGGHWMGIDASAPQIEQAKRLSEGMPISYAVMEAEQLQIPEASLDAITACQCFWYFQHTICAAEFARVLKPGGRVFLLCMEWLPFEDPIAQASETLVLQYSPNWTGAGETMHPIAVPDCYLEQFDVVDTLAYRLPVHFTRLGWHGRMHTCRGVGASLDAASLAAWDAEHWALLCRIAPEEFDIQHYAALTELKKK